MHTRQPFARASFAFAVAILAACRGGSARPMVSPRAGPVDVALVTDETNAALAIVRRESMHAAPSPEQWRALFRSQGYTHLREREASMGRAFTDSSFADFLRSDSLVARFPELERVAPAVEYTDPTTAARMALAYLPARTALRARLHLEIKPKTNSFVFTGGDSVPSIFLYVQTDESGAQLLNTLAHELHHIGTDAAGRGTPEPDSVRTTPAERMLF